MDVLSRGDVLNKQFELPEFVFDSVYVDLQYDEISLIFTAGSVCLLLYSLFNHPHLLIHVGLGVGSWPSNRATEGSKPKGTRLYFVILL